MRPLFYIHQSSCISPQSSFEPVDIDQLFEPADNKLMAREPSYDGIPPGILRRMGKAVRIGVGAALPIIKGPAEINGIIIGTANGGMEDCIKFLNQIIQYEEGQLTPGNFVQSTPNGIAAQLGLISKNRSYNITHVHRGLSFENAAIDAAMQLADHQDNSYLLGAVDEISAYNYNIDWLGDWFKDENTGSGTLYNSGTKGSIAGEGAAMFLVNRQKENAAASIIAIKTLHTPDLNLVQQSLVNFLEQNLAEGERIDLLLSGENGDARIDPYYHACETLMGEGTTIARFKHLCGEFTTASAISCWLSCHILQQQRIPEHMLKRKGNPNALNRILVYNNYRGEQHGFMLLGRA
ncbi:MAG: beta-ketoacyl synthase chain length factor [Chitinophagaceae bacterium]|nr:beta-ketoacyl synthase chain length factor [Chitinophagaceae bacterium]